MSVLPEIAETFQTSTSFILYGIEPADSALAAMSAKLDRLVDEHQDFAAELRTIRDRLDSVHDTLAGVAEETAAALEALARGASAPRGDDPPRDGAGVRLAPSGRKPSPS